MRRGAWSARWLGVGLRGAAVGGLALLAACTALAATSVSAPAALPAHVAALAEVAPGLDPKVLTLALRAATCAVRRGAIASLGLLTVIDYSRPSTEPRLWVLDVPERRLRHRELVAHGRGSGELHATRFSNDDGSKESSLGLFVTAEIYEGRHGRSLRLHGLEPGINDHAFARALVIHGADYVSPEFAAAQGRLGRSHGCPAVALPVVAPLITTIAGGTPLFAYYPDPTWLASSRFLGACADR